MVLPDMLLDGRFAARGILILNTNHLAVLIDAHMVGTQNNTRPIKRALSSLEISGSGFLLLEIPICLRRQKCHQLV